MYVNFLFHLLNSFSIYSPVSSFFYSTLTLRWMHFFPQPLFLFSTYAVFLLLLWFFYVSFELGMEIIEEDGWKCVYNDLRLSLSLTHSLTFANQCLELQSGSHKLFSYKVMHKSAANASNNPQWVFNRLFLSYFLLVFPAACFSSHFFCCYCLLLFNKKTHTKF